MMKKTLIGALVVALALIGTGCNSGASLDAPTVTTEVINDGGTLRLTWDAVTNAQSYEIKADDSTYTTTATTFDVSAPAATIEVRSVKGNSKSDSAATINCKVVETTIDVYRAGATDTMAGFGFGADGSAVTYSVSYANFAFLDFYLDHDTAGMKLVSPGRTPSPHWNDKGNAIKGAASTNYDDVKFADLDPRGTYSTSLTIADSSVYYLWVSADTLSDAHDNFAKAKVVSIEGDKVTLKIGYQKVDGIRWLAN